MNWIRRNDAAEALGDRLGEDRLAGARDVLDEQVAAAQQRDEGEPHLVVLADDHALDVREDAVPGLLDPGHVVPLIGPRGCEYAGRP